MSIERLPGESELQYHKRLVYGKLVDKTLADVDYAELAEDAYGQSYSSDFARRMMYGSCKTLQLMDECAEADIQVDSQSDLDMKRIEFQKERQKFFDQRREYGERSV